MFTYKKLGSLLAVTAVLSGCGGGGGGTSQNGTSGGGTAPGPLANIAPVASITSDSEFIAYGPQETILDGSNSTDTDGAIVSYLWSQTDGEPVQMGNNNESQLRFRSANQSGNLGFSLTVTDNNGASNTQSITMTQTAYYQQLTRGYYHNCAMITDKSDDDVYCWGSGSQAIAPSVSHPTALYSGVNNSCVVDDNGVKCWGSESFGKNEVPSLTGVKTIAIGLRHICALDNSGVKCWGNNDWGQLDPPALVNPVTVTSGEFHSCAQDDTGIVCWGQNDYGQLNVPELTNIKKLYSGARSNCAIDELGLACWGQSNEDILTNGYRNVTNIVDVSLGSHNSCLTFDRGTQGDKIACFIDNLSTAPNIKNNIPAMSNPRSLSVGFEKACVLDDSGVTCWGSFFYDQANIPEYTSVTEMSGGYDHNCIIGTLVDVENQLHCWGNSTNGKTNVPSLSNPHSLTTNDHITCAIDDNGPRCWGVEPDNIVDYESGNPDGSLVYSSQLYIPTLDNVTIITPSYQSLCALSDSGVNCWGGGNEYGELDVPPLLNPTQLASADRFHCAVDDNGVHCWGLMSNDEIPILNSPTSLTAQDAHACAIADNTVHCWGTHDTDLLLVPPFSNPTKVVAGPLHSCAIDDSGVVCWGSNSFGQLRVPVLSNPTNILVSYGQSCAVDDSGLVCWGWEGFGDNKLLTKDQLPNVSPQLSTRITDKAITNLADQTKIPFRAK